MIAELLVKKAKRGVEVNVIYDAVGCLAHLALLPFCARGVELVDSIRSFPAQILQS
jgi:phosphatidylserine/phosphatidylglycerophosphate/cardiolipin synthase-like enzyme